MSEIPRLPRLILRPTKEYPRIPHYLSKPLVTLLIGIFAILGSIVLGVIMFLIIDAKFCGTNANIHSVSLSPTTVFTTNSVTSLLYQKTTPVYDGGYDNIVFWVPTTEKFKPKGSLFFAMILNYTSYPNAHKHTSLIQFNLTGNGINSTQQSNKDNVIGGTVMLHVSNPNRKRLHITEPWFNYKYLEAINRDQLIDKSAIPMWLVDMKEAGRGRQGRRICTTDYGVELFVSNERLQIDPLIVREFAGENVRFVRIVARGKLVFDLAAHTRSKKLNVHLSETDITELYLPKPPKIINAIFYDKGSFLLIVIPFENAPLCELYRTAYKSHKITAYLKPCIQFEHQPIVKIEITFGDLLASQVFCHNEIDGSLTFILAESTLSKIILIVEPTGRGVCMCKYSNTGECVTKRLLKTS